MAAAATPEALTPHEAFVSYSRKDLAFVRSMIDGLAERGMRAWVDLEEIPPTAEWMAEIHAAIDAANIYLIVLSPDSVSSKICAAELDSALASGKRVIPVLHRDVDPGALPEQVRKMNWVLFRDQDDRARALDAIVTGARADLEHLRTHTRLFVKAKEWDERGEDKSLLLRGRDLSEGETWLAQAGGKEPPPTQLHTRYLVASRHAATVRQRGTVGVVTVAMLLTAVLGVVAWGQRNTAIAQRALADERGRVATARELAAVSRTKLDTDPELALLLAIRAAETAQTVETTDALSAAVMGSGLRGQIKNAGAWGDFVLSPDGTRAVLWKHYSQRQLDIWDLQTGALVTEIDGADAMGRLESPTWSQDGTLLAAVARDEERIVVWNADDGTPSDTPAASVRWTSDASITPDGRFIGKRTDAAPGPTIREADGTLITSLPGSGWGATTWSADGTLLAAIKDQKSVHVFDGSTGAPILTIPARYLNGASFDPTGRYLFVDLGIHTEVWDTRTWRRVITLQGGGVSFGHVASSANGLVALLAPGGDTIKVTVYAVPSGRVVSRIEGGAIDPWAMSLNHDASLLAIGQGDGEATVWDTTAGHLVSSVPADPQSVFETAFTKSDLLVTAGRAERLTTWDVTSEIPAAQLVVTTPESFDYVAATTDGGAEAITADGDGAAIFDLATGHELALRPDAGHIHDAAFDPSGERAVTAGATGAQVWDPVSGKRISSMITDAPIREAAISSDGVVLTTDADGTVTTWDATTGAVLADLGTVKGSGSRAEFVGGGREVAIVTSEHEPCANLHASLLDPRTGAVVLDMGGISPEEDDGPGQHGVWVTPDGSVALASSSTHDAQHDVCRGGVSGWDVGGGTALPLPRDAAVLSGNRDAIGLSPDSTLALSEAAPRGQRGNGGVVIWNIRTGEELGTFQGHASWINAVAFSPDGASAATASYDQTAIVWRPETGDIVTTLEGHSGSVRDVAFSPDSQLAVTGSEDGTVRVWRVESGQELMRLDDLASWLPLRPGYYPDQTIRYVSFSPDGRWLIAIGQRSEHALVLRCIPCLPFPELLDLARASAIRSLTAEERTAYLHEPPA